VDFQLENQFSLFEFHWSNAVQQNNIRHQSTDWERTIRAMKLHQYFELARFAGSIFILPNTARS
jgi:hypothetical protein